MSVLATDVPMLSRRTIFIHKKRLART